MLSYRSNRYNYDPVYTSGDESMEDFIDDDGDLVYDEDGDSDKDIKKESTSESDDSAIARKKVFLIVLHTQAYSVKSNV